MDRIYIICVEDQPEVLRAIADDLETFESFCVLEECESAAEAEDLLDDIDAEGDYVGVLVCDHVMPGKTGVQFLAEVDQDRRFPHTRKLLLTGLATQKDTINAINQAGIDRFIEKPWDAEQLAQFVRVLLTEFVLDAGLNYDDYLGELDNPTVLKRLRNG